MSRVAEEVDLPVDLLSRLIAGSLPYFSQSSLREDKISCCQFIIKIMQNFCEKKTSDPFAESVFDPVYESLLSWLPTKNLPTDIQFRNTVMEALAWLCHGLPWNRYEELEKLTRTFQSAISKSPELMESFYQDWPY